LPRTATLIRFRWHYQDERVKYAGRGSVRVAPPDSLRFDYVGPLGLGSGAAVVIGDSVLWADPDKNFRSLVPAIPMLWGYQSSMSGQQFFRIPPRFKYRFMHRSIARTTVFPHLRGINPL